MIQNIYRDLPLSFSQESFDTLTEGKNFKIERILSFGQTTPENEPYEQTHDEWVIVLQGIAHLKMNDKQHILTPGSHLFIPKHQKHWVTYTSTDPHTLWLAVHLF